MDKRRIAIIGGGPVGLEAALYARELGHSVTLYERGGVAENIDRWRFVTMFSPWGMNTTPLGWRAIGRTLSPAEAGRCPTGGELRDRYLAPLAETLGNIVRTGAAVVSIGREAVAKSDEVGTGRRTGLPFRLLIATPTGDERVERADVVLDCSGTYGNHRWAGRGGIPALGERRMAGNVWYDIPDVLGKDRERFADRHTVLLGAGFSAAQVLLALEALVVEAPATRCSWAMRRVGQAMRALHEDSLERRAETVRATLRLADRPPPWLQYLGNCSLEAIGGNADGSLSVTLGYGQTDLALTCDELVAMVGYAPDASLYEQLQVHECYATQGPMKLAATLMGETGGDCLTAGAALSPETLKNPEPDFFILGAKSYGTNSNFLLKVGHQQIRDAFGLIGGQETPDLYAEAGARSPLR